MIEFIARINTAANNFIWGVPAMICIIGVGLLLTIRTKVIQVTRFKIAMCCFAFSTIIGWGLYGSRCIEFLLGPKSIRPFLVIYCFMSIIGATIDLGLMWDIADTFNGLMAIPNLIALLILSGTVAKLSKEHFQG